ncbi:MAG: FMN-binding protein [Propionicimonas sp.]
MKKIVVAIMATISGLVALFSYHTSTESVAATTPQQTESGTTQADPSTTTAAPSATAPAGSTGSASATPTASPSAATSGRDGTYTGDTVQTRWGPVQVEITVKNGRITSADAVQVPSGNPKDRQINAYAVPILNSAAVAAQSASIDAVSGATVTSDGYLESLQSAIDAAHLG